MANTDNLDLKRLDGPKTTKFDYDIYVENNFEKIDAAIGAPPENLTTVSKTIVPAINELDDTKVDKIEGKQLSTEDYSTDEKQKLAGIEPGATADMTAEEIKAAYESNSDTNAYTDSEKSKVSNIPENTNAQLADIESDLSDKAQKLKATNLVVNGDFSQGTTGWGSVDLVVDGIAEKTVTRQYAGIEQPIANHLSYANRKIYASALLKTTSPLVRLAVSDGITNTDVVSLGDNQFQRYSLVKTMASNMTAFIIKIHDLRASGWDKFYADKFKIIDLTATFGAGNEPTKEQMDRLLTEFPNSWFDGTAEILPLKVIPQLLEEKANKAQEAWITPTLLNGALPVAGHPIGYFKDNFGIVRGKGRIQVVNANVDQLQFPTGYKPALNETRMYPLCVINNATVFTRCDIISTGGLRIYATGIYDLSTIAFRAEG